MVYHLGFSCSKINSISVNELHDVNKNQLELLNQRVKRRVNSASAVSIPSYLQKGCNCWLDNAAQKMIRDQLHIPSDPVNKYIEHHYLMY